VYGSFAGFLVIIAVALQPAQPHAQAAEPPQLKIGLPENMFSGLPKIIVQRASQPFQEMFEKESGLKGEIVVSRNYAEIADQLRTGKLDVAVFHGFEYAWVKQHPELVPLVVTVPKTPIQACLVVNCNSKANGLRELKGECIAVPAGTKAHCHVYYERLKETLPADVCLLVKGNNRSIEDVLDAVSDGKCEAALVDGQALATYQKLKPGAGEQLKILAESQSFPSAIVVYRKDSLNADTAKKVTDGLIKCVNTPQGQVLTDMWKLKGFSQKTAQYDKDLEICLKAYPAPKNK
jgi:ABC-type phosphate/phosphonate transport system substrate-binding protein